MKQFRLCGYYCFIGIILQDGHHPHCAHFFTTAKLQLCDMEQSLSRIHRIGQRNVCTYIDLVVQDSVDEKITKALRKKEDLATKIVDNWKEFFK